MKIINCKIKRTSIIYEVLTNGNQLFTYELPKDLSSYHTKKCLNLIEQKIDSDNKTNNNSL
ncbi:hypothetical protein [Staphylococcus debuckii]|uniref:hypothetical protein n=1 Tax=Staphylococcus debuckii TaxID=2044912 RepID=UPI000F42FD10|nr:hypothetical protein [Staphylococcus debuckii]AYU54639.1 hypothetical protein CNQ82_04040 [Staphylococcus debuckii]